MRRITTLLLFTLIFSISYSTGNKHSHTFEKDEFEIRYIKKSIHLDEDVQYHLRNDNKWQSLGQYVWPNPVWFNTHQEEVDHLKQWYQTRMNWLDTAIDSL